MKSRPSPEVRNQGFTSQLSHLGAVICLSHDVLICNNPSLANCLEMKWDNMFKNDQHECGLNPCRAPYP